MSSSTQNRLSDFISGMTQKDSGVILQKFYEAAYKHCAYRPDEGDRKWSLLLDALRDVLPKGSRCLDIGCGPGHSVRAMVRDGYEGYGVDFANIGGLWSDIKDRCITADAQRLPFADCSFDLVMSNDVLEHLTEYSIPVALSEIMRVGKNITAISVCLIEEISPVAGKVFTHITVRPAEWWRERFHDAGIHRFSEYETPQRLNIVHLR